MCSMGEKIHSWTVGKENVLQRMDTAFFNMLETRVRQIVLQTYADQVL